VNARVRTVQLCDGRDDIGSGGGRAAEFRGPSMASQLGPIYADEHRTFAALVEFFLWLILTLLTLGLCLLQLRAFSSASASRSSGVARDIRM
jgi:hypothetical protein